jgi:hypothetical protein
MPKELELPANPSGYLPRVRRLGFDMRDGSRAAQEMTSFWNQPRMLAHSETLTETPSQPPSSLRS